MQLEQVEVRLPGVLVGLDPLQQPVEAVLDVVGHVGVGADAGLGGDEPGLVGLGDLGQQLERLGLALGRPALDEHGGQRD